VKATRLFIASSAACVAISASMAWGHPIWSARWTFLWRLSLWVIFAAIAVFAALRLPPRRAGLLIVAAALALRLAALAGPPTTSDDLYRYSWDGRVQQAGIDPYAAPPSAPQLAPLRDGWLWPTPSECATFKGAPGCTRINRPSERTIYPPAAEAWFGAVYRIGGSGSRYKVWQVAGLAVDMATVGLLLLALRRWRRDLRWAALYALAPFPVLEFVNNGHVDGVAVALIVGAIAIAAPPGAEDPPAMARRDVLLGLVIGAAALVKVYPAMLLLAVPCLPGRAPLRSLTRATAAAGALAVAAYAPHVIAVGTRVLGYLPGYLREEHYDTGMRFLLVGLLHLSGPLAIGVVAAVLLGAAVWVLRRRPAFPVGCAVLLLALLLTTTPVQPWYGVLLIALAAVCGKPSWAAVTMAAYPYFYGVLLADSKATAFGQAGYVIALIIVVAAIRRRPSYPPPKTVEPAGSQHALV
jgi:hypothetical protein